VDFLQKEKLTFTYDILTRTDVGTYGYSQANAGPHAVTGITDATGTLLSEQNQSVSYTAFNKASHISQGTKDYFITYGPDRLRRRTSLHNYMADDALMTKYYAFGDFEQETDATGTRHLHYISAGDGLAAVYVKNENAADSLYFIMKDHLGSITGAINAESGGVYRQNFDAWGRKRNPENWTYEDTPEYFPLSRGFTGHEHLKWFGLINMNGRMYDASLCRFLSPDPFVQMPDYSQNFNRYSYALNNPLVYTDPSGEFIIAAIMLGAFINTSIQLISGNVNNMGGVALALGIGGLSGAAGAGVGSAVSSIAGGSIGAGSGAISGAAGGFASGFVGGAGNAWANGANFSDGITAGLVGGGWGALGGAVVGGIAGGIRANKMGLDFWDGTGISISESQVVVNNGGSLDGDPTGINNTSSLNDFKNANFKGSEYASAIYGDESKKLLEMTGYTLDKNSGSFINSKGEFVSGFTVASKEGVFAQLNTMIGISPNSAIYSNNLKAVLGHELIHAYHYQTGFMTRYGEATSEYYCYRYSASVISSNQLNYSNSMNYIWKPQAVKIPFGFKTVYPSWVPRNIF
jgi:RHS repeat-associated protein